VIRSTAVHPAATPATAAQAHRLRLCQELQLDALRLSFTTALLETRAGQVTSGEPPAGPRGLLHRPWRRWLVEDLDRALDLADAMADLSAGTGSDGGRDRPGARIAGVDAEDDLVVHYRTMAALLRELLDGVRPLEPESARSAVRSVLERVEQRIHDFGGQHDPVTWASDPVLPLNP
jgi:hypothetical protein